MATRSWIFPTPGTADVPGARSVRLEAMSGAIEVREHEAAHVHVAIEDVSGPAVRLTLDDGALSVGHAPSGVEGLWRRLVPSSASGRTRLRVHVPAGTPVSVSAGAAETHVAGLTEDAELSATSGRVTAVDCRAALRVSTRGGDIVLRGHRGDAHLATLSGRADVAGSMPVVDLSTGSSDVWLANTSPESSRMTVSSFSGAVNVRVLPEVGVRLSATKLGGSATLDGRSVELGRGNVVTEGAGGALAEVRASMVTGALVVRRDAETL